MDITAYIESGILEHYVAGALSENENKEVYQLMCQHPEILQEVLEIENAIVKLTASTSVGYTALLYNKIKSKIIPNLSEITPETKVVSMAEPKTNWLTYSGWAAALVIGVGLLWSLNKNNGLESKISEFETESSSLEAQIVNSKTNLEATKKFLNIIRDKDIIAVPLGGQGEFATTYAKVYWDKNDNSIYLDAQGLPTPPEGKVYQVWSLKLNPLAPTSLGTIDNFESDDTKIFTIANANESQAFGITLEPEGGSETPTMDQLYTLGIVEAPVS